MHAQEAKQDTRHGAEFGALCARVQALEAAHHNAAAAAAARRSDGKRMALIGVGVGALLAAAEAVYSQGAGEALFIDALGKVGIGISAPKAQLDLQQEPRTDLKNHPDSVKVIYVTGALGEASGIEFRHSNGSQGIGFGYNTMYATGSNADQNLNLKPRGAGKVIVQGSLEGMGAIPKGAILMWSGNPAQLPPGWVLCDGANDTPDLRSRFIVGYDSRVADYNAVKKSGGLERVALSQAELGNHVHAVNQAGSATGSHYHRWAGSSTTDAGANVAVYGPSTGGAVKVAEAAAHENRPPYMVLAYIMYTGTAR